MNIQEALGGSWDSVSRLLVPKHLCSLALTSKDNFISLYPKVIPFLSVDEAVPFSLTILPSIQILKDWYIQKSILSNSLVSAIFLTSHSSPISASIVLNRLIEMGANIDSICIKLPKCLNSLHHLLPPTFSTYPFSALNFSILVSNVEATRILLQSKADIDVSFTSGLCLVDFAAQLGNPGILRLLVERETERGRVKEPELLIEELLHIWKKRIETMEFSFDILSLASFFGCTRVVKWILSLRNYEHNLTPCGISPLHFAVLGGHKEIVKILLEDRKWGVQKYKGVMPHDLPGIWGLSPFHIAAYLGNESLVKIFMTHNTKPSILPEPFEVEYLDGRSPLDLAAMQGHTKVVDLLLSHLSLSHLTSAPICELTSQLLELAKRANIDNAPSMLLMAMKEKNSFLTNILLENKYPHVCSGNEWMEEFSSPVAIGGEKKQKHESGFLLNHLSQSPRPQFMQGLPILPFRAPSCGSGGLFYLAVHLGDMNLIEKWKPQPTPKQAFISILTSARRNAALQGHESVLMNIVKMMDLDSNELKYSLEHASAGGHLQLVTKILEMGAPVFLNHSLLAACFHGHLNVVKLLLDYDANMETINTIKTQNGNMSFNALHVAAHRGHLEIVRELLLRGAKVDSKVGANQTNLPNPGNWGAQGVNKSPDFVSVTALHRALESGHEEVAIELIHAGAETHTDNNSLEATSLFFACKRGLKEVVKICLERTNYHPLVFRHMLAVAALYGHLEVAKQLIDEVDLNTVGDHDPFPFAVAGGNAELVQMMLERGSSIGSITRESTMTVGGCETSFYKNSIPFFIPVQKGNEEVVRLLLDYGVYVDLTDSKGYTALMYSVSIKSDGVTDLVKLMVERGADINYSSTVSQESPFIIAAKNENVDLVAYLIQQGANTDLSRCGHRLALRLREQLLDEKYGKEVVAVIEKEINSLDFAIRRGYFYATQLVANITRNKCDPGKLIVGRFRTRAEAELMFKGFGIQAIELSGVAELVGIKTPYWLVVFNKNETRKADATARSKNKDKSARSNLKYVLYENLLILNY